MLSKISSICYKLIPWYYLVFLGIAYYLVPKNYSEPFVAAESTTLSFFVLAILIFPIIEELIVRYWLFGKDNYCRVGFMVSFVLCVFFTIFNVYGEYKFNDYLGRTILTCITVLGLIISSFLKIKKVNVDKLISFINTFNRSWITVIIVSFYFIVYHMDGLHDFNLFFLSHKIMSSLLTVVARKYGIIASILIHMINNSIAIGGVMAFENIGAVYYYATVFLTIILIIIYMNYVGQLEKGEKVDLWQFTKKIPLFK